MSYLEDILMHPPQSSFCNLKALTIFSCVGLTYLFTISMTQVLTKLESLEIRACLALKSVIDVESTEATVITFHKLKFLSLQNLPELISLCAPVNVIKLPQLMELELKILPNITSIFPQNNINNSAEQPLLNKDQVKFEKLSISRMNNLKEIWPCETTSSEGEVNKISSLRKIEVNYCDNLVNLFPSNPMQLLIHLEELKVMECGSIEVLFNIDFDKIKQHNSCVFLRNIEVWYCDNFREVWRIKDAKDNNSSLLISAIELISISDCKRFRNIVTPATVNFDMRKLKVIDMQHCGKHGDRNTELLSNSQQINTMSNEEVSKAFPSYHIIKNFHHLREITFWGFEGVEVVFEIGSPSNNRDNLVTTQQQHPPLLPYLEVLDLKDMDVLSHVWKCDNWNEFFIHHKHQPQSSFQNLRSIRLSHCKRIKYLFSPLMVKLLCNLKEVLIDSCDGMEEVVSNKDDGYEEMTTSISTHTTTILFRRLHFLGLSDMKNLKYIDGGGTAKGTTNVSRGQSKFSRLDVVCWSFCQYFKRIDIHRCNALSSAFPCYVAGNVQKLEEMSIENCKSMIEVFETKQTNIHRCTSSTKVAISRPRISTMHKLPNLKNLTINHCERLENIFTFSTLQTLNKLETLTIRDCEAMKMIVREEYGEHTTTSSTDVTFPCLKSVILDHLPNIEGFFLGMNIDFEWPLLDFVEIIDCPQMMVFTTGQSKAPRLKYMHTKLGKHNLEFDLNFHMAHQTPPTSLDISSGRTISEGRLLSFHTLTECYLGTSYNDKKIFLSNELQQLQKLEIIHAVDCYNVEEVFEVAVELTDNESQTVVKFPKLRKVKLCGLRRLDYIWKSNQRRTLEFPYLTTLSISVCNRLEPVFTCCMVGGVMQLQELHISCCEDMKVIVKEDEDFDAKVCGIKFPCLKSLKLENLSRLEGFCLVKEDIILPSLDNLVIKYCPKIRVFSEGHSVTPQLTQVETILGSFNVGEDVNSFVMRETQEGFSFGEVTDSCSSYDLE